MHTHLYYDQVTWTTLSYATKSFQKLHNHTMYVGGLSIPLLSLHSLVMIGVANKR